MLLPFTSMTADGDITCRSVVSLRQLAASSETEKALLGVMSRVCRAIMTRASSLVSLTTKVANLVFFLSYLCQARVQAGSV